MPEDVDGVGAVLARNPLERRDPVGDRRARRAIDERMEAVEHQIAHVHDIRGFERDRHVTAGVAEAIVFRDDHFLADLQLPDVGERLVRVRLIGLRLRVRRRFLLPVRRIGVRHDEFHGRAECLVAGRVIGVMVCVDQDVDSAARLPLESLDTRLCRRGELTVDHHRALVGDQPADGAAPTREDAGAAAKLLEPGGRPRLPALGERRPFPQRGHHDGRRGRGEELSSIH